MVEAFCHARYFVEMAVTYGQKLTAPPRLLPSGWAALLHLAVPEPKSGWRVSRRRHM
jgi:hypothetical protein